MPAGHSTRKTCVPDSKTVARLISGLNSNVLPKDVTKNFEDGNAKTAHQNNTQVVSTALPIHEIRRTDESISSPNLDIQINPYIERQAAQGVVDGTIGS